MTLFFGMLLDALFGEPRWLWSRIPHPAVLMGRLIAWCDERLNAGTRKQLMGALTITGLCIGAAGLGWVIQLVPGYILDVVVLAILLAQKSLVEHVQAVGDALRLSLGDGRRSVAMIVGRDTKAMDTSAVARSAIESAAENLSDGVIAPAFWFLVGGLPALVAYKCINTADSMIGYRTPRHHAFGWAAARTDDLVNLVPSRLTALFISTASAQFDLPVLRRDARLHRSPNAGWPEAAMARSLGIALAGPRAYDGEMQTFPWVNDNARRILSPIDIDASIVILWQAWGVMFFLCALTGFLTA